MDESVMYLIVILVVCCLMRCACYKIMDDGTISATDNGLYHRSWCLRISEDNYDGEYETIEEAENDGYEPCSWCN